MPVLGRALLDRSGDGGVRALRGAGVVTDPPPSPGGGRHAARKAGTGHATTRWDPRHLRGTS
jgi:hypothetical protein